MSTYKQQLLKIEEREKQLKNQKEQLLTKQRQQDLARENRKKIIVGSVLMKLSNTDVAMKKALLKCIDDMQSKDRELFSNLISELTKPQQKENPEQSKVGEIK